MASAVCLGVAALAVLLAAAIFVTALWHDGSLAAVSWTLLGLPLLGVNPLLLVFGALFNAHGPSDFTAALLRLLPTILLLACFEALQRVEDLARPQRCGFDVPKLLGAPTTTVCWLASSHGDDDGEVGNGSTGGGDGEGGAPGGGSAVAAAGDRHADAPHESRVHW